MMKKRWGLDRNVLRPTPGDPWGVEQHHWNTGAEELFIAIDTPMAIRSESFCVFEVQKKYIKRPRNVTANPVDQEEENIYKTFSAQKEQTNAGEV